MDRGGNAVNRYGKDVNRDENIMNGGRIIANRDRKIVNEGEIYIYINGKEIYVSRRRNTGNG